MRWVPRLVPVGAALSAVGSVLSAVGDALRAMDWTRLVRWMFTAGLLHRVALIALV